MPPIIHIKEGVWVNLATIAFMLALAGFAVWLDHRSHGEVNVFVWVLAAVFVLACYFPIDDIRKSKSRLLIVEGDYLVWRIRGKEGEGLREERIPLSQIRALEFVIPKDATSRNSRLISCAELYFITAQGKCELPLDFFPGVYRDKIVAAIRQHVPTIQVLEVSDDVG
jgi:hypothetical protein